MASIPYKVVKRTTYVKNEKKAVYTPKFKAKAVDTAEDVTTDTISGKTVEFRAGSTVEKKLKTAKFRKINLDLEHV